MIQLFTAIADTLKGKIPFTLKRSKLWSGIRNAFLIKHPVCAACGGKDKLEVHHIVPFHVNPELELNEDNLITLCENKKYGINCHLLVGHLGNYKKYNKSVKEDAMTWYCKLHEDQTIGQTYEYTI